MIVSKLTAKLSGGSPLRQLDRAVEGNYRYILRMILTEDTLLLHTHSINEF
jgi:hypothetical protein